VVHPPPLRRLRDCPPVRAGWLYVALAALATLASGRLFYGYMLHQTGGEWSAPLDDVFIHFDYARATARGAPFQWTEGNGYSSGNTSLSYPFVLAFGYWLGFRSSSLMMWAAVVASMATLGFLWSLPRLFGALPRATHFLAIAGIFSVGALSWSLWSGMEVAFFLGVWGLLLALAHGTATGQYPRRAGSSSSGPAPKRSPRWASSRCGALASWPAAGDAHSICPPCSSWCCQPSLASSCKRA
jgi:hypothetical protein